MKKLIIIFILIFSLSFFCGCGTESLSLPSDFILSSINFSSSGEISHSIAISVDSQNIDKVAKVGESVQFKSNLIKEIDNLRQKFLINFAVVYLKNPIEEFKIGHGFKITPTSYKEEGDLVSFDMIFSSSLAWKYYHQSMNDGEGESSLPFLIKKHSSASNFPFSGQDLHGDKISQSYINIYLSASKGLSFEKYIKDNYNPSFIYNYSTYISKIKSDADYKYKSSANEFHHVWLAREEGLEDKRTTIYYYQINKGNWLLLALTIPSVGLGGYFLYKCLKNKKRKI